MYYKYFVMKETYYEKPFFRVMIRIGLSFLS